MISSHKWRVGARKQYNGHVQDSYLQSVEWSSQLSRMIRSSCTVRGKKIVETGNCNCLSFLWAHGPFPLVEQLSTCIEQWWVKSLDYGLDDDRYNLSAHSLNLNPVSVLTNPVQFHLEVISFQMIHLASLQQWLGGIVLRNNSIQHILFKLRLEIVTYIYGCIFRIFWISPWLQRNQSRRFRKESWDLAIDTNNFFVSFWNILHCIVHSPKFSPRTMLFQL